MQHNSPAYTHQPQPVPASYVHCMSKRNPAATPCLHWLLEGCMRSWAGPSISAPGSSWACRSEAACLVLRRSRGQCFGPRYPGKCAAAGSNASLPACSSTCRVGQGGAGQPAQWRLMAGARSSASCPVAADSRSTRRSPHPRMCKCAAGRLATNSLVPAPSCMHECMHPPLHLPS